VAPLPAFAFMLTSSLSAPAVSPKSYGSRRRAFVLPGPASATADPTSIERATAPSPVATDPAPSRCVTATLGSLFSPPLSQPPRSCRLHPLFWPPSVEDVCPETFAEDSLPTSEIQLHIAINAFSHLNAVKQARSLSVEEMSLREFLLDQILFL
jgi:hypothetical protein